MVEGVWGQPTRRSAAACRLGLYPCPAMGWYTLGAGQQQLCELRDAVEMDV